MRGLQLPGRDRGVSVRGPPRARARGQHPRPIVRAGVQGSFQPHPEVRLPPTRALRDPRVREGVGDQRRPGGRVLHGGAAEDAPHQRRVDSSLPGPVRSGRGVFRIHRVERGVLFGERASVADSAEPFRRRGGVHQVHAQGGGTTPNDADGVHSGPISRRSDPMSASSAPEGPRGPALRMRAVWGRYVHQPREQLGGDGSRAVPVAARGDGARRRRVRGEGGRRRAHAPENDACGLVRLRQARPMSAASAPKGPCGFALRVRAVPRGHVHQPGEHRRHELREVLVSRGRYGAR